MEVTLTPFLETVARSDSDPVLTLTPFLRDRGERIVLGFRTFDGVIGLNEVHRIEEFDGKIARIRCYCFAPDTLAEIANELGLVALRKPYRSP